MTKKTRYFMVASAAILAGGLCVGLVAYYAGFPMVAFTSGVGPEELKYIPADASLVGYVDVRDVMNSEFRERVRALEGHQAEGQREFKEKTGIAIDQDIDRVVACGMKEGGAEPGGMILARGRFDTVRLEALAREHGAEVQEYQGKRVILRDHRKRHDEPDRAGHGSTSGEAMAFIEPGLIAMGSRPTVYRAIDLFGGKGENITSNDAVMGLVRDVPQGSNAWAVGRFDLLKRGAKLPQEVADRLPPIEWFVASGQVNGGVRGTLRAEANTDEAAKNLRDVMTGFMALAKLQTDSNPELRTFVESIELGGQGKTVAVSFSVPAKLIDRLAPRTRRDAP